MRSRTCADELPARCPQVGRIEVIGNGGPRQMVVAGETRYRIRLTDRLATKWQL